MIKKIMCPLDLKPGSEKAILYAFYLAKSTGAHVTIVHANPNILDNEEEMMLRISLEKFHAEEEKIKEALTQTIKHLLENQELKPYIDTVSHDVNIIAQKASAGKSLLNFAVANNADLIVLSKRGIRSKVEVLFRDVAEDLIYGCKIPIVIISD